MTKTVWISKLPVKLGVCGVRRLRYLRIRHTKPILSDNSVLFVHTLSRDRIECFWNAASHKAV